MFDAFVASQQTTFLFRLSQQLQEDSVPEKQEFYALMNLPAFALNFLPSFVGLLDQSLAAAAHNFSLWVYCYTFVKGELSAMETEARKLVEKQFEGLYGKPLELRVRDVRNVAPYKEQVCVEFEAPKDMLFKCADDDASTNDEPSLKRTKL